MNRAALEEALRTGNLRKLVAELIRFVGVGGLTTVVYFAALWISVKLLALPMWAHAAVACAPSFAVGYVLHRSYTFKSDKQHASAGPRFVIVQLAGVAFNSAAIWVGTDLAHFPFLIVQFAAIALQVVLTYLGQKFFAFS